MIRNPRRNRFWAMGLIIVFTVLLSGCRINLLDSSQSSLGISAEESESSSRDSAGSGGEDASSDSEIESTETSQEDKGDAEPSTTESAPPVVPLSERVINSVFGEMVWFESDAYDFAILRPEPWDEISAEECSSPGATVCFVGGPGGIIITEEDLDSLPREDRNRDGYVDFLFEIFDEGSDFTIVQFSEAQSEQGLPVDIFSLTSQEDEISLERFIFVDEENQVAFNATIFIATEMAETLAPAIGYIQDSFRFWPMEDRAESSVYHLDEARWHIANEAYGFAIDALSQALELAPDSRAAYQLRALLYREENMLEKALADASRVVELAPKLPAAYRERALTNYLLSNNNDALADLEVAIELDPDNPSHNNLRALVYAVSGDPEPGLADMDAALEKSGGTLPIHIQDTRGFVYLVLGEYEKAKEDYDTIFAQEEQFGHALLGAGIAYYEVGETDSGIALIEAGLAEFDEEEFENPEPQLGVLVEMAEAIIGAE